MNLDRYFDKIMETACEQCVFPEIAVSQDDMERLCSVCPLVKAVSKTLKELEHAAGCTAERAVKAKIRSGKNGI